MKKEKEIEKLLQQIKYSIQVISVRQKLILKKQSRLLELLSSELPGQPVAEEMKPINPEEGD